MGEPRVRLEGVARTFGTGPTRVRALDGVDLEVGAGEFVAVMGPSGSGKSTLLHLAGGLASPTEGRVFVEGRDLATRDDEALTTLRRRRIGFVFQAFNLVDVLTARENVAIPLLVDGAGADAYARADRSLVSVGVGDRREHYPRELSGGEQQRVALARALIAEPGIVLADEPTGNLDSATGDEVMALLRGIVDDAGQTVLMVTHDARHAAVADRIVRLRDGRRESPDRSGATAGDGEEPPV